MKTTKNILFGFCIVAFMLPALQLKFKILPDSKPLEGGAVCSTKPEFSKSAYFNSIYQDSINLYINDNIGFRNGLVRGFNTIKYSAFKSTNAPGVVVGKDGFLFIESYIQNIMGLNYIGDKNIAENTRKIKRVQEELKKVDIDLLVVFTPGKASYYSELIPNRYIHKKQAKTNYNEYRSAFNQQKVGYLDFAEHFIKNKNQFKYPVFPTFGTHWTRYAMGQVVDSLGHYLSKATSIEQPELSMKNIVLSDSLRHPDYDVGEMLNLLRPLKDKPMPYPEFSASEVPTKLDALIVGDSYWWCVVGVNIPRKIFARDVYWFYNKDLIVDNGKKDNGVKDLNFMEEIQQRDVILLMATEATLHLFTYGFVDKLYGLLCATKEERVAEIKEEIKTNRNWLKDVEEKAFIKDITIEEQMNADANYMYEQEQITRNNYLANAKSKSVNKIIKAILRDEVWYTQIKQKALMNKIPLNQQLYLDAKFVKENL